MKTAVFWDIFTSVTIKDVLTRGSRLEPHGILSQKTTFYMGCIPEEGDIHNYRCENFKFSIREDIFQCLSIYSVGIDLIYLEMLVLLSC
jgi:hypothetical protein